MKKYCSNCGIYVPENQPCHNIRFKQTITVESNIAMSPREWEQVKEYLEDNGYENVTLSDAKVIS